jgi:hypothetical protein
MPGASSVDYPSRVVYVIELCALTRLCVNGDQLFDLEQLQPFACRWRQGALRKLVNQLEAGRLWRGTNDSSVATLS